MLNSKFIKIIVVIVIILILAFTFLFVRKNNQAIVSENTNSTSTLTADNGRPVLNTNFSNNSATTTENTTVSENNYTNVNPADYAGSGPEDILRKKIEKILFNWGVTKDEKSLRDAIALSENADNEAVLSAWISFMKTDSAELVKIINTSTDIKRTKNTVSTIFQWFIELSGEYEKLSPAKKQQLTNQYNQLK